MARPGVINRTIAVQARTHAVAAGSISIQDSFVSGERSQDYDPLGVVADRNPPMRQQHDSAAHLLVLIIVDGLKRAAAQQRLEDDGELEKAEARAEATLDTAAEGDPRIGRRVGVQEPLRPELMRAVVCLRVQI